MMVMNMILIIFFYEFIGKCNRQTSPARLHRDNMIRIKLRESFERENKVCTDQTKVIPVLIITNLD